MISSILKKKESKKRLELDSEGISLFLYRAYSDSLSSSLLSVNILLHRLVTMTKEALKLQNLAPNSRRLTSFELLIKEYINAFQSKLQFFTEEIYLSFMKMMQDSIKDIEVISKLRKTDREYTQSMAEFASKFTPKKKLESLKKLQKSINQFLEPNRSNTGCSSRSVKKKNSGLSAKLDRITKRRGGNKIDQKLLNGLTLRNIIGKSKERVSGSKPRKKRNKSLHKLKNKYISSKSKDRARKKGSESAMRSRMNLNDWVQKSLRRTVNNKVVIKDPFEDYRDSFKMTFSVPNPQGKVSKIGFLGFTPQKNPQQSTRLMKTCKLTRKKRKMSYGRLERHSEGVSTNMVVVSHNSKIDPNISILSSEGQRRGRESANKEVLRIADGSVDGYNPLNVVVETHRSEQLTSLASDLNQDMSIRNAEYALRIKQYKPPSTVKDYHKTLWLSQGGQFAGFFTSNYQGLYSFAIGSKSRIKETLVSYNKHSLMDFVFFESLGIGFVVEFETGNLLRLGKMSRLTRIGKVQRSNPLNFLRVNQAQSTLAIRTEELVIRMIFDIKNYPITPGIAIKTKNKILDFALFGETNVITLSKSTLEVYRVKRNESVLKMFESESFSHSKQAPIKLCICPQNKYLLISYVNNMKEMRPCKLELLILKKSKKRNSVEIEKLGDLMLEHRPFAQVSNSPFLHLSLNFTSAPDSLLDENKGREILPMILAMQYGGSNTLIVYQFNPGTLDSGRRRGEISPMSSNDLAVKGEFIEIKTVENYHNRTIGDMKVANGEIWSIDWGGVIKKMMLISIT